MTTDPISADGYELVDFGRGAKLERFGPYTIQRPCPVAERCQPKDTETWQRADAICLRRADRSFSWTLRSELPESWEIHLDGLTLQVRRTAAGQLGVFPEQRENWGWLGGQIRRAARPLHVLNLFAYTGASTVAAAIAGAHVTHVDAAKSAVAWARRNAALAGLSTDCVRWVVEDVRKFVRREIRRGRYYDGVILDPPSYGHGPHKEPWKIETDLPLLLADCRQLLSDRPAIVVVTSHSPSFGMPELQAAVDSFLFHSCAAGSHASRLTLRTASGRELPSGVVVRWPGGSR